MYAKYEYLANMSRRTVGKAGMKLRGKPNERSNFLGNEISSVTRREKNQHA